MNFFSQLFNVDPSTLNRFGNAANSIAAAGGANQGYIPQQQQQAPQMPQQPNGAATGLGHVLGADPSSVSSTAGKISNIANGIAAAGAAPPDDAPQLPVNNYMQLLDPATLHAIMQQFGGQHP